MNKFFNTYYLILGILLFSCAAKDEGDRNIFFERNMKQELISELESEFNSDRISNNQIMGFKVKGEQKVKDFTDYIEIMSNPDYPELFIRKAKEEAKHLFKIDSKYISNQNNFEVSMEEFIDVQTSINLDAADIELEWLSESQALSSEGKLGIIQAVIKTEELDSPDQIFTFNFNIYVLKIPKKFGEQISEVWEVKLGNLEFVAREIIKE
ncbi:hypothetical protein [Flexithrix dorotheae]|uniref:hypothetical protein n=1 Tax=Flexithrix dorotheae TaxID=70993 RepID=UPI00036AF351|nr:hypothetical protein [Flexithrix dorotheae]